MAMYKTSWQEEHAEMSTEIENLRQELAEANERIEELSEDLAEAQEHRRIEHAYGPTGLGECHVPREPKAEGCECQQLACQKLSTEVVRDALQKQLAAKEKELAKASATANRYYNELFNATVKVAELREKLRVKHSAWADEVLTANRAHAELAEVQGVCSKNGELLAESLFREEKKDAALAEVGEELSEVVTSALVVDGFPESTPNAAGQPVSTEPKPSELVDYAIRTLKKEQAELVALLRQLEFSSGDRYTCPSCYRYDEEGHADNCKLAAALKKYGNSEGGS